MKIGDQSVLERVYGACADAKHTLIADTSIDPLVVVLGPEKDEMVREYCEERKWPFSYGSMDDLYDRYEKGMDEFMVDHVIRITSDCWDMQPERIIETARSLGRFDYVSNTVIRSYPEGQEVQGCSRDAFKWISKHAKDREHMFSDFDLNRTFRKRFESAGFHWANMGDLRSPIFELNSIDSQKDLDNARRVHEARS